METKNKGGTHEDQEQEGMELMTFSLNRHHRLMMCVLSLLPTSIVKEAGMM